MPFKSEKQRRYLWANEPEIARKWENEYNMGGSVMKGLLDHKDLDTSISMKDGSGRTITVKSPKGVETNLGGLLGGSVTTQSSRRGYQGGGLIGGPYYGPTHDNVPISANPGEFVMNVPAAQNPQFRPMIEAMNNWGRQQLKKGGFVGKRAMGYAVGGEIPPGYLDAVKVVTEGSSSDQERVRYSRMVTWDASQYVPWGDSVSTRTRWK